MRSDNYLESFDKTCEKDFGLKTCIIVEMDSENHQLRLLDKGITKEVRTELLARIIPDMLQYKYIVVVVKNVGRDRKDITAVHYPDSRLTAPPLFFS